MNRQEPPRFVYFVRLASGEGPIKIGCSLEPQRRLTDLMHWSPYPLAILATMPGDYALEARCHLRFSRQHSHGEWFHPSDDLLSLIEKVRAGQFDPSDLDVMPGTRSPRYSAELGAWWSTRAKVRRMQKAGVKIPQDVLRALDYAPDIEPEEKIRRRQLVTRFVDAALEPTE